jgi:ribosomal-protein-alanine N-acetyltransferase
MNQRTPPFLIWLRRVEKCDLRAIVRIEQASFDYPQLEEDIASLLLQDCYHGLAAIHGTRLVGYMFYARLHGWIELDAIAVAEPYRRSGVGWALASRLPGMIDAECRSVRSLVRETNLEGQLFLRSLGFFATRVLDNYWHEYDESAYEMRYTPDPLVRRRLQRKTFTNRIARYLETE